MDQDLMRLRHENLELHHQNIECRRNLDLMRQNMDLQKAKVVTEILNWIDVNSPKEDYSGFQTSTHGNTHDYALGRQSRDFDDTRPLVGSSLYHSQRGRGNECNHASLESACSSPSQIKTPTITYRPVQSKSQTEPAKHVTENALLSHSVIEQATFCDDSESPIRRHIDSPRRNRKLSPARTVSPRRPLPQPVSDVRNTSDIDAVQTTVAIKESSPSKERESCSKIAFDKDYNPVDVESGLSLKDRRIIDRPIDSILEKPTMTLYQTYAYANTLKPKHRLIGEIAFQLERRILDYVFGKKQTVVRGDTKKRRFYGYTLKNIESKIVEEAMGESGEIDAVAEASMRHGLRYITRILAPLNYDIKFHGDFAEKMVNHYGLLNTSPEKTTIDNFGLEDPRVLRVLLAKLIPDETVLKHTLILLDGLCLLAHHDKRPLFLW